MDLLLALDEHGVPPPAAEAVANLDGSLTVVAEEVVAKSLSVEAFKQFAQALKELGDVMVGVEFPGAVRGDMNRLLEAAEAAKRDLPTP
jgi:hypothetical protein